MLVDDVGADRADAAEEAPSRSRLARARELAARAARRAARTIASAPVVFAGAASHFPVTEDHEVATRFLYDLGPADLPPGSNLAEVFRVSRCLLRPDLYDDLGCARIGRRGHGGDPLPARALDPTEQAGRDEDVVEREGRARQGDGDLHRRRRVRRRSAASEVATSRELGIAVFVVGVGTQAGRRRLRRSITRASATATPKRDANGQTVISKRDDAGMKLLAEAGGDPRRYFVATETRRGRSDADRRGAASGQSRPGDEAGQREAATSSSRSCSRA